MKNPMCVNLRDRFGQRYRIAHEESFRAERSRGTDPWSLVLRCRFGHIFPWGGNTLAASVDGHPKVAGRMRELDCVQVVQDGDLGELTVTFDAKDFAKVAEILRPRRRRQVTEEQREQLIAQLRRRNPGASEAPIKEQHTARGGVSKSEPEPKYLPGQLPLFEV